MSTTISESPKPSNNNISKGGTTVIYPESFWQEHVETYLASGYNKSQYCRQHNLIYHRFLHWYRKFTGANKKTIGRGSSFIPVKLKSTSPAAGCICTLELADGNRLLIHDESTLHRLLPKLLK
jgi:hypothetical protein